MLSFFKRGISRCPLCGARVSWKEEKVAEYACLYVCIRAVPYPKHMLDSHRDYLDQAKKVARPIFFTALFLTFLTVIAIVMLAIHYITLSILFATIAVWTYGWYVRRKLLKKYSAIFSATR